MGNKDQKVIEEKVVAAEKEARKKEKQAQW